MNTFEQVEALVRSGDLQITYIDHLPRTISHALKRSLFEIFDGQVNEPFFVKGKMNFKGFGEGCQEIIDEYNARRAEFPAKKPITILVKDVAKSLPGDSWEQWLGITQNVISLVRDPHLQIYSLMEAIANDHLNPGENKATKLQVLGEMGPRIAKTILLYGKSDVNTTSWKPLGSHSALLDLHMQQHPEKRHIVLDGNVLLLQPEAAMQELAAMIAHVSYKPSMLRDWSKSEGGFPRDRDWGGSDVVTSGGRKNTWTNKAFEQNGFKSAATAPIPVAEFPLSMQNHILHDALPIYLDLLNHPHCIGHKNVREVTALLKTPVNEQGQTFQEVNPTTAYAFMASLPYESFEADAQKAATLADIRQASPEHSLTFDSIDSILQRTPDGHDPVQFIGASKLGIKRIPGTGKGGV